jgi:hypothetical protein
MINVKKFVKLKGNSKKYEITFEKNGKTYTRKFGSAGMSDFTIHKDKERRERYISRHKKDLRTKDPMKPGYLSMYILWNKPSLKASLADYKRRLNVYNKTGKFPTDISGSKKLSFGMKNAAQIKDILADKVRWDPAQIILEYAAAPELQKLARGYLARKFTKSKRYIKMVLLAINIDFYISIRRSMGSNFDPEQYAIEQMTPDSGEPWLALNPLKHDTAFLLKKMSSILTKKDLSDDLLWYNIISYVLDEIVSLDPDNIQYRGQQGINVEQSADYTLELLNKMGYPYGPGDDLYEWYNNALAWLEEENVIELNFGKKYQAPDNVVNKKMYESIKSKIQRSIKGRRWGAYDSGRLVREYKSKGGKYTGSKGKSNLSRWYKEKWVDACAWPKRKPCGRKTKKSIAYCRPSKKVDSKTPKLVQKLTKAQINSRCARKKKTPMKRITKFGKAEPDVDVGNGWVIHCNHINGIGPHATLRQKQLAGPTPETDHAFRYGIKYRGGAPEFWAGGDFAKSGTGLPNVLGQKLLMDYFYNNCGGQNPRMLPPKSPVHYSYNKFGDKKKLRQDMYNDIILGSSNDMRDNVTNALIKRCPGALTPRLDNKECSKRMTELILSIYYTMIKDKSIKLNTKRKREINTKIRSISKVYGPPSLLNLRKKYLIDELLIGLQGGYFGKVFKGELSNYILESIIT